MVLRGNRHRVWDGPSTTALAFLVLIAVSGLLAGAAAAEGLTGYLELNLSDTETETTDAAGRSSRSETGSFTQRYNLILDKTIFPNLTFQAGGFFERQDGTVTVDDVESDATRTSVRPHAILRLRTPLYGAEVGYFRNEEKLEFAGISTSPTVRETYSSMAYWKPEGLPDLKVEYLRTDRYDKDHRTQDTTEDRAGLTAKYRPFASLDLRYEAFVGEREDRITGSTIEDTSQNARVIYSDRWFHRRTSVDSDYNYIHNETKTQTTGGGEVGFQLFPFAGLSAISDTPETVALDVNLLLVDGDLLAGAGINLGVPPLGGDARPRHAGLDFGTATEVNTLLVTVDRDVAQVAGAFSWRIYTSPDNLNWTFVQTVAPAVYSSLTLRFEIRFTNVTARYVKLVVSPLSLATPFASGFPNILVTELQAELRRPATEVAGTVSRSTHRYNLNVRTRILEKPYLAHEFSYFLRKTDPATSPTEYTVSNGLALQHQLAKAVSARARVAREDGRERAGHRKAYLYSASIAAVPLETLNHVFVYSGVDETIGEESTVSHSFSLVNNAKLYEGIDVSLGGGASFTETGTGQKTDQTQYNGSATVVPNRFVAFNMLFTGSTSTTKGGNLPGERETSIHSWEGNVSVTPLPTLYLFASHREDRRSEADGRRSDTTRSYAFNFSPFPYGTLHLNFTYTEVLRSADDSRERTILPSLRWNVTPRSYLDLSYFRTTTDSAIQSIDTRAVNSTFRFNF